MNICESLDTVTGINRDGQWSAVVLCHWRHLGSEVRWQASGPLHLLSRVVLGVTRDKASKCFPFESMLSLQTVFSNDMSNSINVLIVSNISLLSEVQAKPSANDMGRPTKRTCVLYREGTTTKAPRAPPAHIQFNEQVAF